MSEPTLAFHFGGPRRHFDLREYNEAEYLQMDLDFLACLQPFSQGK
jgi:hypothetical protein